MSWEKLSKHFHGSHGARDAIGSRHDDVLVYRASEHAGMHDRYDGGAGRDTLQLEFTREQWRGGAVAGPSHAISAGKMHDTPLPAPVGATVMRWPSPDCQMGSSSGSMRTSTRRPRGRSALRQPSSRRASRGFCG